MSLIEYKSYHIKPHKEIPTSYIVVTSGQGGKVPDVLSGMFTHPTLAKKVIDTYLLEKPLKEVDNDKKVSKSRS